MRTIAVSNQKGGCGKTTTAINLAVALARVGKRVLIVDFDPQACTTLALSGEPNALPATIYHPLVHPSVPLSEIILRTNVESLDLAPTNVSLAAAEVELIGESGRELRLAGALRTVRDAYDLCVIDCPPSLGALTLNALVASTDVIVPVHVDSYALECAKRLLETVLIIRRRFHRYSAGNLRILLTCVEDRTALGKRVQQQMRELFGDLVFRTVIHRTAALPEAIAAGKAIVTYAPSSTAAVEYTSLAQELLSATGQPASEEIPPAVEMVAESLLHPAQERAAASSTSLVPAVSSRAREPAAAESPVSSSPRKRRSSRSRARGRDKAAVRKSDATSPGEWPASQPESVASGGTTAPALFMPLASDGAKPRHQGPAGPARESRKAPDYILPAEPSRARRKPLAWVALAVALIAGVAALVMGLRNQPPLANSVKLTTQEDTSLAIDLTGVDRNGDSLTYTVVTDPSHGRLSGNPPKIVYTPALNYSGPDSFTFTTNDGRAYSESATVSISVTSRNDPPVAVAQSMNVEDNGSMSITLRGNDMDGDTPMFGIVRQPTSGALTLDPQFTTNGKLVYTPSRGFRGSDEFSFKVSDGMADSEFAAVAVHVVHVNVPPTGRSREVTTQEDTPLTIALAGDDPEQDPLTYTIVSAPAHGSLNGTPPDVVYVPALNYTGADTFTFTANDGKADSTPATVSIQVSPINDPPMARIRSITVEDNNSLPVVLAGDDADGDPITFALVDSPQHGILVPDSQFAATGKLLYRPEPNFTGEDRFTFKVNDGTLDSSVAGVSVDIVHVNRLPRANDRELTTAEDVPLPIVLEATDPERGPLTYTVTAAPMNGALAGISPNLEYIPNTNFHGSDAFTYDVTDAQGGKASAKVTIQVTAVNDPPEIVSVPGTIATVGRLYAYDVNATDPDGKSSFTYSLVQAPVGMTVNAATGRVEWRPTLTYVGSHQVEIQVADTDAAPESSVHTFLLSVEIPSLQKVVIPVAGGYDQRSRTLSSNDCAVAVQVADDHCWETPAGSYTVYNFANTSIPADAEIKSLVLYVRHYEESQFPAGKLEWKLGTGWPEKPVQLASVNAAVFDGKDNRGTITWDFTGAVKKSETINSLQFQVKNNCTTPQKRSFMDHVYLVAEWR